MKSRVCTRDFIWSYEALRLEPAGESARSVEEFCQAAAEPNFALKVLNRLLVWPLLSSRVPSGTKLRVTSCGAGQALVEAA